MSEPIFISIVVPVHNEQENLPLLHAEIGRALESLGERGRRSEILYVDDRSTDRSLERMLELWRADARVRVIQFRRNFGQTAALAAGFDHARGEVVVTLDGDLQNDPGDIPLLVQELERGFDVVAGWRRKRLDGFMLRRLPSRLANWLIARTTGVAIHDTGCTLKAFRREVVKSLVIYAEQHRFLPVISAGSGARVSEVVVNHRARRFGRSKYGLSRALRVVIDLMVVKYITQFSQRPIQYFGILSLGTLAASLLFAGTAFLASASDPGAIAVGGTFLREQDWEMAIVTVLTVLFSGFVYFAFLGLLGELVVKASGMHRRSTLDRILNELHG
jgi:glycosyltransferase involved in cell wall biosynthesis